MFQQNSFEPQAQQIMPYAILDPPKGYKLQL